MKKLLLGLVVLGAVASGVWFHYVQTRTASDISVWSMIAGVAAAPAFRLLMDTSAAIVDPTDSITHVATYKVAANQSEKFFVLAHYHVEHLGISTEYDLALPVYEKKPDAAQWTKLDSHLTSVAYLDGGTINYRNMNTLPLPFSCIS